MQTVDEHIKTLHIYVVRDEAPKPQLYPIILSVLALFILVALAVAVPYQQPVTRLTIRVPAVLLPLKTFTEQVAIIPTGVKVYPATTAHGVLTITNGSIIGQSIPSGFTIAGVATDTAVYVPGGNANGYGWAQVPAHVLTAGKSGNLSAYAINSVIGSSVYVRNLMVFHGGHDAYSVRFVTNQDRQTARMTARNQLAIISAGLHYPCNEAVRVSKRAVGVSWRCQYVTYHLPSYMHVTGTTMVGKNVLVAAWFVARPTHIWVK